MRLFGDRRADFAAGERRLGPNPSTDSLRAARKDVDAGPNAGAADPDLLPQSMLQAPVHLSSTLALAPALYTSICCWMEIHGRQTTSCTIHRLQHTCIRPQLGLVKESGRMGIELSVRGSRGIFSGPELIETYVPQELDLWVQHYNHILSRPNNQEYWPVYVAYDSEVRQRSCTTGTSLDPAVFHLGIWNDLEAKHIARVAIDTVRAEISKSSALFRGAKSQGASGNRYHPYLDSSGAHGHSNTGNNSF
ncbi:hypothetical protein B0H13DRAFT_2300965 [Mycena leptocephala]|nr:hypothetical protein B0H13DRAFT_2300965 [Mycena leptocephala]